MKNVPVEFFTGSPKVCVDSFPQPTSLKFWWHLDFIELISEEFKMFCLVMGLWYLDGLKKLFPSSDANAQAVVKSFFKHFPLKEY